MSWNVHLIPLISTRVCLYRPDRPRNIIVRYSQNEDRLLLPGGKLHSHSLETLEDGARREIRQETLLDIKAIELIALLPCSRLVHIDPTEALEMGISKRRIPCSGLTGLVTLEVLFAAPTKGKVPTRLVEGRRIGEIRLTKQSISEFKPRHQRAAEICLQYLLRGRVRLTNSEQKLMGGFHKTFSLRAA